MIDYLEEEEIKIEYNDFFETDPLLHKLHTNPVETGNVPCISSNTEECEISSVNNSGIFIFDSISSTSEKQHYCDDVPIGTQTTWYRDVDESGKLVCRFCELTYSTIQTIRHHVKTKHPERANALKIITKNNKRNPKIKCYVCKKQFKHISILKEHIKEHFSENLLKSCKVCFATFNNEQEVMLHLYQKHQNIVNTKIYFCSTCGYQTQKLSHFKQHKNTHLINKKLKCDNCDYATNYLPNLRIHQFIHTNEKPYACSYKDCEYRSVAKSALRSHQLKHYPDENMQFCDKCTYKTVYRHSLKKHMESHGRNSLKVT